MRPPALLTILLIGVWLAAQAQAPPPTDPFLAGQPLTLEQVAEAAPVIYEGRLRQAILARGLGFTATPQALDQLRKAGVSEELLQVIARLSPPPVAARPKDIPRAGPLTMACAPAECEVLVNGVSQGATAGGVKEIRGLGTGKVFLDFKKEGYEGQQADLTLEAGVAATHRVTLAPTALTRQQFGAGLFARVMETLGGDAGLAAVQSLAATGQATLWDRDGRRTEWSLLLRLQLPDRAYWEFRGGNQNWWVSRLGGQTKAGGSGNLRGSPVAQLIERLLAELAAHQPAEVIRRIRRDNLRLLADATAPTGADAVALRAEGDAAGYSLVVGQDYTLARAAFGNSGLEARYADYRPAGAGRYPMTTTLEYAGAARQGVEIRLNKLDPNPKWRDRDFRK